MNCDEARAQFLDRLHAATRDASPSDWQAHAEQCAACAAWTAWQAGLDQMLAAQLGAVQPSEAWRLRMRLSARTLAHPLSEAEIAARQRQMQDEFERSRLDWRKVLSPRAWVFAAAYAATLTAVSTGVFAILRLPLATASGSQLVGATVTACLLAFFGWAGMRGARLCLP